MNRTATDRILPMGRWLVSLLASACLLAAGPALAAVAISGQVLGGQSPIAKSTVTLWAAGAAAPIQLAQATTGADGRFTLSASSVPGPDAKLYVIARGGHAAAANAGADNPAIALLTVLGNKLPAKITINEMTTVASVWTHNQFITGTAIKGQPLQLKIAAGNVPSFVDLATGGLGATIQDSLNGGQTPTLANFSTLADALAGCVTNVRSDACARLFAAATGPTGGTPADTLTAAQSIAKYPWYRPERVFALLDAFYPVPKGKNLRPAPYAPYLQFSPSAWVLPLKFDGGGYRAGGKAMFDAEGNLWVGDNFTVGWQANDALWQGHATKFDPNGKPLSPITTGFTGGGMEGGTFGAAIDLKGNVWLSSYGSKSITVFNKDGRPLTPPEGINFGGRLGLMQGIITAPNGDVWALGISKRQLLYFPKGDWNNGKIVCEGDSAEPCKSFTAPFHLAIDQQDRIWVSDSSFHVIRFPAADPTKAVKLDVRTNNSGLNIDSQGNVWVTNRFGSGLIGMAHMVDMAVHLKKGGVLSASDYLTKTMSEQKGGSGSVTLLRPDGTQFPGSPFKGGGLPGPWAVVVDGNDNVWVSNFAMSASPIVQLCGVRTEHCPPGFKTGDQISPPGGYVGGGLQLQTDIAIGPAGDVWAINNWQDIDSCYAGATEALSTRCGGQGVTIFFGMAKPVRAPQIGPARAW
jgi:sugar lactone lactonase YvrE